MQTPNLIVVDDNPDHQALLHRAMVDACPLAQLSFAAHLGELAFALRRTRFDCVILDFQLVPHTAPQVLKKVEHLLDDTPVIVISSSCAQEVVIQSLRQGVSDYIPKVDALKPGVLWQRVEMAMGRAKSARRERRASERYLRVLRREADTEPLTGLFNRRRAMQLFATPCSEIAYAGNLACIMIDLDHFKEINDLHGHQTGDQVLVRFSKILKRNATKGDVLVRWGGDEFVVVRSVKDLSDAWAWARRLAKDVEAESMDGDKFARRITTSIGIAIVPSDECAFECLNHADRAMYMAKMNGRNRICTWPMVELLEAASELRDTISMPASTPIARFRNCLDDSLGEVQRFYLGPHSDLVRHIALLIGTQLRLRSEELDSLGLAGVVHDIGKAGIPETLLAKPTPLDDDERAFVTEHTRFGAELAEQLGLPTNVVRILLQMHGSLTPNRPNEGEHHSRETQASIVSTADAMAAMIVNRPFAPAVSFVEALNRLEHDPQRFSDPRILGAVRSLNASAILAPYHVGPTVAAPGDNSRSQTNSTFSNSRIGPHFTRAANHRTHAVLQPQVAEADDCISHASD